MSFPDNIQKIEEYNLKNVDNRTDRKRNFHEPDNGDIEYKNKVYSFKFSHEFGEGNTYIVYDENSTPVYYFCLYTDIDGEDEESPMIKYEK